VPRLRPRLRHPPGLHRRRADGLPELRRNAAEGVRRRRRDVQRLRVLPDRLARWYEVRGRFVVGVELVVGLGIGGVVLGVVFVGVFFVVGIVVLRLFVLVVELFFLLLGLRSLTPAPPVPPTWRKDRSCSKASESSSSAGT
jgi:hypothetical protein